jgi:cyclopropane-fatty-acyl-phospholipid synthase
MNLVQKTLDEINKDAQYGISVILPDGKKYGNGKNIVIIKNKQALSDIIKDIEIGFCENYLHKNIEIKGSLEEVIIDALRFSNKFEMKKNFKYYLFNTYKKLLKLLNKDVQQEIKNIQYHYDLDNDFYKKWLDESMTYSCGFFENKNMTLEDAQELKRKIIYEKLLLKKDDIFLDIGCGWGSIIIEAAKKIGCKSIGITLSQNQYEYIVDLINREGLDDKVEVHMMHYKDLVNFKYKFTKIVSVGMFEHVGRENLNDFFKTVKKVMTDDGLFLLHYIGKIETVINQQNWITKRIFPGGYLPSLEEIFPIIRKNRFGFIDLDNWRMHYYYTLKEWYKRFSNIKEYVIQRFGEEFYRMWELYLLGSAALFYIGDIYLFQILISKKVNNDYPIIERKILKNS